MNIRQFLAMTGMILGSMAVIGAQTTPSGFINGVVQGDKGPEAGVWVIAETKDLPTNFIKIVVTDDRGKFVLPDLPNVNYQVWVRGYGLVDSTPLASEAGGDTSNAESGSAKTPQEAAKVYPGNYWLSLMAPPSPSLFPGTGPEGNGVGSSMLSQDHWINSLEVGLQFLPPTGEPLTRDTGHVFTGKPEIKTPLEAWEWRLGPGVRGTNMYTALGQMGKDPTLASFADWTEGIAKGDVPPAPPRPKGIERNIVATLWDVGDDHSFMHDQVSTDKNHPTVNAGGREYAVNAGHGQLVVLDPRDNSTYSHGDSRRANPRRRFLRAFPRRTARRCSGATSTYGPILPTIRPIRTIRCSTARAACG